MSKKVGLIGEDPNDTDSIKNLLLKKYQGKATFVHLLKNKRGHQLDNERTRAALLIECEDKKPNIIVCIRDADALITEKEKIAAKIKWYQNLLKGLPTNLLLLNIYELEALILTDIEVFNKLYGTTIKFDKDINYLKEPKEFLIKATKNKKKVYRESHCPDIFNKLNIDTVSKKSGRFKIFLSEFDKLM